MHRAWAACAYHLYVFVSRYLSVTGILICVGYLYVVVYYPYTAISRKVVGIKVHATIPKGNVGYDQYTVPDTVAVEPTFVAFL